MNLKVSVNLKMSESKSEYVKPECEYESKSEHVKPKRGCVSLNLSI